ncbi:hypothetical protein [Bradyrhizobium sp. RDM4]|uniref:hypothetical protein n=1 Tax=Bradyrhizobium sp. RDM4 TaxID=3378765 RepID=UPI0038FCF2DD
MGQCIDNKKSCFFSDDKGHIYRFDDDGPSWSYLGQLDHPQQRAYVWLFNVAPDGNTAYIGTSFQSDGKEGALFAFDLRTATTKTLCNFPDLDPSMEARVRM